MSSRTWFQGHALGMEARQTDNLLETMLNMKQEERTKLLLAVIQFLFPLMGDIDVVD